MFDHLGRKLNGCLTTLAVQSNEGSVLNFLRKTQNREERGKNGVCGCNGEGRGGTSANAGTFFPFWESMDQDSPPYFFWLEWEKKGRLEGVGAVENGGSDGEINGFLET